MNKKVVILGGGTGTSTLVRGLKQFPVDISVVVSVCDDGSSTGILRKEFDIPAVGDLRKVIASLSKTEPLFEKLLEYRFKTTSDLNGHTVGNLLLVALCNITGNMSDGIESLSKVLNIEGNVLPLTEDNVTLVGKMKDKSIIEGEHNITECKKGIKDIYYKEVPVINPLVIKEIKEADMLILSMGSLYTSIICNLISKDVINAIDDSKGKIVYVCNMFTQPGETDEFTVSKHVEVLNKYLGKRKVETVIVNGGKIPQKYIDKYHREEEKDPVIIDNENLNKMDIKIIKDDFINLEDGTLKHDTIKLSFKIFEELVFDWKLNNYSKNDESEMVDKEWNKLYSLAKDYYTKKGNLLIPYDYCIYDNEEEICLGAWIISQRNKYNGLDLKSLSKKQINLLEKIGMIWDILKYEQIDEYLNEQYLLYETRKLSDNQILKLVEDGVLIYSDNDKNKLTKADTFKYYKKCNSLYKNKL